MWSSATEIVDLWVLAWIGIACWLDWRQRRLPNYLIVLGIGSAMTGQLLTGTGPLGIDIYESLLATLLGVVLLLPFYLAGLVGGGDVKFVGALGYLGGVIPLLATLALGALCQVVGALVLALVSARPITKSQPFALTHGPVFVGIVAWRYFS